MKPSELIQLNDGGAYCTLSPQQGGIIAEWTIDGQAMLRGCDDKALHDNDPLKSASFPLVPYSNRIGYGHFVWAGEEKHIRPNFPPEPHAIHGVGWKRPWSVKQQNSRMCEIELAFIANEDWHWSFTATQRIEITERELKMTLSAKNDETFPVPLAFGHHPYFEREGATLTFGADTVWQRGADGLPEYPETPTGQYDFTNGDTVASRTVDSGYAGWNGTARISWAGRPKMLEIESDMTAAVVFVPQNADYFCFEPVPHIIDALNLPGHKPEMPVIAPGEVFQATITFTAT
jgi:aldose 1-epimerase